MSARRCLDCRRLTTNGTRCKNCTKPKRPGYTWAERKRRAQVVNAHRAQHGEVCPGWDRPPHHVEPPNVLTADHLVAVAAGGAEAGALGVLCRECNGAKQART